MIRKSLALASVVIGALVIIGIVIHQVRFEHLPADTVADSLVIEKGARRLMLIRNGKTLKAYRVSLGREPNGPKRFEGDKRTPEGNYVIDRRKEDSSFHLALHVSYPTPQQIAAASLEGRSPGGDIMIHGIRNGFAAIGPLHRFFDWTQGCIAVTDGEMDELWRAVPNGTPIEIRP